MLVIIILGGICASFVYAVTSMKNFSFLYRRSECDNCKKSLKWYELVPVLSYFLLKGRCSRCRQKIDISYPICELLVIILYVIPLFLDLGLKDYTLYYLIVTLLIPLSLHDFRTLTIPNHMTLLFLFTGLFLTDLYYVEPLKDLGAILILHIIYTLFSESIGYGDIKLFIVLTLVTPINFFIYAVLMTYIVGGVFIIILTLYRERIVQKVPLVPFLATSLILCFFLYEEFNLIYYGGFL